MNHAQPNQSNLLLIGGATRNVGKTTLSKRIIQHFSQEHTIIGLKIKTLRSGDEAFHGKGRHELIGDFLVSEESYTNPDDTGTLYQAGASRVFHIKTQHHALPEAVSQFLKLVEPDNALILCESNSLREILEPAVFLLIRHRDTPNQMKPSAAALLPLANRTIWTNGTQHDFSPEHQLAIHENTWKLLH